MGRGSDSKGRAHRTAPEVLEPDISAAEAAEPAVSSEPEVSEPLPQQDPGDSFDGACNICGRAQVFTRNHASLREGYSCAQCRSLLRDRGQAERIIRQYTQAGASTIAELIDEPGFRELSIWEPGTVGPFRAYFGPLPNYVMSGYWPDVPLGEERDGLRCEDLMAVTFPDQSFDLVITSDIFEHVRKPYVGFAEVHRILRPGGRHIFSIPVQAPMRDVTIERVDTSSDEDVFLLEPRYHGGPGNGRHLVYNDFGLDLILHLVDVGFDTEVVAFDTVSP